MHTPSDIICNVMYQVKVKNPTRKLWYRPFKSFASIMRGDACFLWYGFLTQQESLEELFPHVQRVAQRHTDAGVLIRAFYVDKCCQYRAKLLAVSMGCLQCRSVVVWATLVCIGGRPRTLL